MQINTLKPSGAFVGASWAAFLAGTLAYLVGLWNSNMQINERGYYFAVLVLVLGLFAAVSLQKTVRDRAEGIPVTDIYGSLCWAALAIAILLECVGLWNAGLSPSEKGFFAMAFTLCLFAVVTVQKNIRDAAQFPAEDDAAGKASALSRFMPRQHSEDPVKPDVD
jgi:uncharacterized membrane protein YiaA